MVSNKQKAFTIVELMIAMSVFAVALTLMTAGVIQIGRYYQSGVTKTKLINLSREIQAKIAQDYEYNSEDPTTQTGINILGYPNLYSALCVGTSRYLYITGKPGNDNFIIDKIDGTAQCNQSAISPEAQKPMPNNAVVAQFEMTGTGVYKITTKFVIGDKDMFEDNDYNKNCKLEAGKEFCAVIKFESDVVRKVE